MFILVASVSALLLPPTQEAEPSQGQTATRAALQTCVEQAATRLERSRETAPVVAASALEACHSERRAFVVAVAGDDWRLAQELERQLDARLLRIAQSRVVEIRARRGS